MENLHDPLERRKTIAMENVRHVYQSLRYLREQWLRQAEKSLLPRIIAFDATIKRCEQIMAELDNLNHKPKYEAWTTLWKIERLFFPMLHEKVLLPLTTTFFDRLEGGEIPEFPGTGVKSVEISGGIQSIYNAADALAADYCVSLNNFPNTCNLLGITDQWNKDINLPIVTFGVSSEPLIVPSTGVILLPSALKYRNILAWTLLAHEASHAYISVCFDPQVRKKFSAANAMMKECIAPLSKYLPEIFTLSDFTPSDIGSLVHEMVCDLTATLIGGEFFIYSLLFIYYPQILIFNDYVGLPVPQLAPLPVSFRINMCRKVLESAWGVGDHTEELIEWINSHGLEYERHLKQVSQEVRNSASNEFDEEEKKRIYLAARNLEQVLRLHKIFGKVDREDFDQFIQDCKLIPAIKRLIGSGNDFYGTKESCSFRQGDKQDKAYIEEKVRSKSNLLDRLSENLANGNVVPGRFENVVLRPRDFIATLFSARINEKGWRGLKETFSKEREANLASLVVSILHTNVALQRMGYTLKESVNI